jgi:serine/threonine-protein kinase
MAEASSDEKFGAVALGLGLLTESQLQDALQVRRNMEALGIKESLKDVLLKKGLLSQPQVAQVLRTMGVQVQPIPGYQILSRVGQGGMGTVYKAKQVSMERIVALKVLSSKAVEGKNFVDRFFREAQAAARLNHRNVIGAYDAGCANGIYYFAMEFVEGATVRHLIDKEGRIEEKKSINIIAQAAEALAYLHENGMIHRDIKPENIMLDRSGTAKLCDFGLAKSVTADLGVTKAGFTFGTPYYMSPEQINGAKDLDIRSDLYSLGASFFHMITGRTVFDGKDLRDVLTKHLTELPASPSTLVPTLSERTCKIVLKMLEKDRKHRYQDPRQLLEDLNHILGGREPVHARRIRRARSSFWPAAAALLLLALGVGGGVYYALNQGKPRPTPQPPVARHQEAPRPPAPPPAPAPPPPAPPADPKEPEAQALYARARALQTERQFKEAKTLYESLDKNFFATETFQKNKVDIWKQIAECQKGLDAIAVKADQVEKKREEELRDLLKRTHTAYLAGRWKEAQELCEQLVFADDLPSDFDRPALNEIKARCQKELRAPEEWAKLQTLARLGQWIEFLGGLKAFQETYSSTRAAVDLQLEIAKYEVKANKELAADKAIRELKALAAGQFWDEFRKQAEAVQRAHGATDAYERSREEIARFAEMGKPPDPAETREAAAKRELEAAHALFDGRKFSEAVAAYDRLLNEYGETRAVESAKSLIVQRKELIAAETAKEREKAAQDKYKEAKKLHDAKKFSEALPVLKALAEEFAETKFVSRSRDIAKLTESCEKRIAMEELANLDDFEREKPDGWFDRDPAKFELTDVARSGKQALRIGFGHHDRDPAEGNWPRILRRIERELPLETAAITFWGRVERKDIRAKVWIEILLGEGKSEAVYALEQQLGKDWQFFRFYLSEFRLKWLGEDVRRGKAPPLDPRKIRAIGFSEIHGHGEIAFFIDDLRLEFSGDR